MSYSIQTNDYMVDNLSLNHVNHTKVIIHDSEVQEIINMMKEDLNLEKFNNQNDLITPNDIEPKRDEYEEGDTTSISSPKVTFESIDSSQNELDNPHEEDDDKDNADLIDFIEKAKVFNANALDLSRKHIEKIPRKLLELNQLQYIYLEGNDLTELPNRFFEAFTQLRWLDLRNNKLTDLPTLGLSKLSCLKCLLLENNKLTHLPNEIASLRNLNALNLSDNPLEYPPIDIVNKGLKSVQIYMKKEQLRTANINIDIMTDQDIDDYLYDIQTVPDEDDVWASDVEDYVSTNNRSVKSASKYSTSEISLNNYFKNCNARINSATKNLLTTKSVNPSENSDPNFALKERIYNAKSNANKLSNKLLTKRKLLPPVEVAIYKNEELEKALRNGRIDKYRKTKEQIDAKLQKVNDNIVTDEFRTKLKAQQRKNQHRRLTKGVDFVEPVKKAPFDISEDHLIVMNKEDREFYDKAIEEQTKRPLSPDTLWQLEEERRLRDNELQNRIRDYTNKLLVRRLNKNQNPKLDRIQASRDLKELKKIEKELGQRKTELQHNLRSVTGDAIYKETAKLNAKATLANVMKQLK